MACLVTRRAMDVRSLAEELHVWDRLERAVRQRLDPGVAAGLIGRLAVLPIRSSRASGSLGAYVHRGAQPVAIRIQFQQESGQVADTLLHELAHACDHLTRPPGKAFHRVHGPRWQAWARELGANPSRTAHSEALAELRRKRLRVVAVCQRCGAEFLRLRRLPHRRSWVHPACGNGAVVPVQDA